MFREIRGNRVHTVSFGAGDETILGIPGSIGTWEVWQQPLELLGDRYRTISYDHYGAGETRVTDEWVTFEHQVELVVDLLDAFEVDRCVLAGDSSMSAVAIEVARRWPGRVSALVVVSGGVRFPATPSVERFIRGLRSNAEPTIRGFVDLCLPEDEQGHLRAWLRDIIARTGGDRAARLLESFAEVDVTAALPEVRAPALVIHGEHDGLPHSLAEAAEEMARALPRAELIVLPGAGHVPTLSRPQEVAGAIDSFLAALELPAATEVATR